MNNTAGKSNMSDQLEALDAVQRHSVNEYSTRAIAKKVLRAGDVALDLGANEGFHTFHLASLVGNTGRVHAFEPNPSHWKNLLDHANVRLWPVAVGDRNSVENFYLPVENNLNQVGSLVDPRDFLGSVDMTILTVPQVPIDSLEELASAKIHFVKMDIERRELFCMKGMRNALVTSQPVVIFENNTPEIEEFLDAIGYSVHGLVLGAKIDALPNALAIPNVRLPDIEDIALNDKEIKGILEL